MQALLILVFVLIAGMMTCAEIALVSARRTHLMSLAEQGNRNALAAMRLIKNTSRFLATIQVGITLAGFFASAEGAVSFVGPVAETFEGSGVDFLEHYGHAIAVI